MSTFLCNPPEKGVDSAVWITKGVPSVDFDHNAPLDLDDPKIYRLSLPESQSGR